MVAGAAMVFAKTDVEAKARGVTAFLVAASISRGVAERLARHGHARGRPGRAVVRPRAHPLSHRLGAEGTGFYR